MNEKDFRFKRFSVLQSAQVHKVGTDGVLLGAWANFSDSKTILDIGTGTGLIALMAAQKSNAEITGLDDDPQAIEISKLNFMNSPWKSRLTATCCALQNYEPGLLFDHIVSNPPFFVNSLKSPDSRRNIQRHTDSLPHEILILAQKKFLKPDGKFSVILPEVEAQHFRLGATSAGLYLNRIKKVYPKPGGPCTRLLMEFGFSSNTCITDELIIQYNHNEYTPDYRSLTADFYLNF